MPISHSPCRRRYIGPLPSCVFRIHRKERKESTWPLLMYYCRSRSMWSLSQMKRVFIHVYWKVNAAAALLHKKPVACNWEPRGNIQQNLVTDKTAYSQWFSRRGYMVNQNLCLFIFHLWCSHLSMWQTFLYHKTNPPVSSLTHSKGFRIGPVSEKKKGCNFWHKPSITLALYLQ